MDPATVAMLMMQWTCATQVAAASVSGYITLVNISGSNPRRIEVIRAGKVVADVSLKQVRRHPELDFKLHPGDTLVGAQSWF